jgi:hypothetical protein
MSSDVEQMHLSPGLILMTFGLPRAIRSTEIPDRRLASELPWGREWYTLPTHYVQLIYACASIYADDKSQQPSRFRTPRLLPAVP